MKKLIVALSTIFCTVLIAVSIYSAVPKNNSRSAESISRTGFTVMDFGGRVAVFRDGESEPLEIYNIYTHLLPENDIELLRRGIHVDDPAKLQECLEDLGL